MKLGIRLVRIAAAYLIIGAAMGVAMGMSGDFRLISVHAHLSLLGWATLAIVGLVYVLLPGYGETRLAAVHFWAHNVSLPLMMAGLSFHAYGYEEAVGVAAGGSLLLLLAIVAFAANIYRGQGPIKQDAA